LTSPERVVASALVLLVAFGGGCSMVKGTALPPATASTAQQERRFAEALHSVKAGKDQEARALLEQVVAGQPLPGVTDEALFRLALLYLRDEDGEDGEDDIPTRAALARLTKEYPLSIWTRQATPLAGYLDRVNALRESQKALTAQLEQSQSRLREVQRESKSHRDELRTLRERNNSLLRDNKELRKLLDSLKSLDLEMEQKIKR